MIGSFYPEGSELMTEGGSFPNSRTGQTSAQNRALFFSYHSRSQYSGWLGGNKICMPDDFKAMSRLKPNEMSSVRANSIYNISDE